MRDKPRPRVGRDSLETTFREMRAKVLGEKKLEHAEELSTGRLRLALHEHEERAAVGPAAPH